MSNKIEFTSNYGQFAYRFTAVIGDDVNPATVALCKEGLANIAYRAAGSAVDKALGVKTKDNPRYGSRSEVEYSDEDAERINAAASAALDKLVSSESGAALKGLQLSFAVIGQHEYGQKNETGKTASAVAELLDDTMAEMLRVKFDMPGASKEEVVKAFLASKRETKKK